MMPTLIVLLLVILAVAAVVWVVRKGPTPRPDEDQDTAWNDPITPAESAHQPPHKSEPRP